MPSRAAMRRGRRDHFTKDIGNRSFEDEADVITVALASKSKNALVESPGARRKGSARFSGREYGLYFVTYRSAAWPQWPPPVAA